VAVLRKPHNSSDIERDLRSPRIEGHRKSASGNVYYCRRDANKEDLEEVKYAIGLLTTSWIEAIEAQS
jgi:hypothetical protein